MLTPVDIQQKKFHVGLGYDKKDVNTFFDSVSENYEKLYRSNAELKEKVSVLNDTLQNYRSKEENLEKSLKLAEKDTVETISKATKEAKSIIRDAKNQAQNILADAEARLEILQDEIAVLEAKYAAYKSNFCTLLKKQFEFLDINDFDVDAMIDDRAWSLIGGSTKQPEAASVSDNFGAYTGDPQMRDESTLGGGLNGGYGSGDVTSTSAVYTQSLSAGENFVDPFKPQEEKEYNPFENKAKKDSSDSKLRVTDSAEAKKRMKRATVGSTEASAAAEKAKHVAEQSAKQQAPKQEAPVKETPKKETPAPETPKQEAPTPEEPKQEAPAPETPKQEAPAPEEPKEDSVSSIPTIQAGTKEEDTEEANTEEVSEEENLEGEVEEKNGPALLGEGEDDSETDDDGFEFI